MCFASAAQCIVCIQDDALRAAGLSEAAGHHDRTDSGSVLICNFQF